MRRARRPVPRARGFSLVEIAVGLVILGLSAAGLVAVIGQQSEHRRLVETRASLSAARDALLAYVAANGRLPCPATAGSAGQESRVAPGSAQCTQTAGLLPAVTLGLPGLEEMPYFGIFAPRGTPAAFIERFSSATAQVLAHAL